MASTTSPLFRALISLVASSSSIVTLVIDIITPLYDISACLIHTLRLAPLDIKSVARSNMNLHGQIAVILSDKHLKSKELRVWS